MKIIGPERYKITYTPQEFNLSVTSHCHDFSGIAATIWPKIYIASLNDHPIYVGMTKQPLTRRLRYGWKAAGKSGYYGYAWRHSGSEANLDVWGHRDADNRNERDVETIEAEIVYLIRKSGQWPEFQTEIHFYQSNSEHRAIAVQIAQFYKL